MARVNELILDLSAGRRARLGAWRGLAGPGICRLRLALPLGRVRIAQLAEAIELIRTL